MNIRIMPATIIYIDYNNEKTISELNFLKNVLGKRYSTDFIKDKNDFKMLCNNYSTIIIF
jgi:hypothetical protein